MIAPVRLRSRQILRDARRALRQPRNDEILRRRTKLLGLKALRAAQKAFDLQEQAFVRLSAINRGRDWEARRQAVESLLREIVRGLT